METLAENESEDNMGNELEIMEVRFTDGAALSRAKDIEAVIQTTIEIERFIEKMGGSVRLEKPDGLYALTFNSTDVWFSLSVKFEISRIKEYFSKSTSGDPRSGHEACTSLSLPETDQETARG